MSDKFVYEEGDIQLGDSVCEFCANYNDGARCELCPKDNLKEIEAGDIKCPQYKHEASSVFDDLLKGGLDL